MEGTSFVKTTEYLEEEGQKLDEVKDIDADQTKNLDEANKEIDNCLEELQKLENIQGDRRTKAFWDEFKNYVKAVKDKIGELKKKMYNVQQNQKKLETAHQEMFDKNKAEIEKTRSSIWRDRLRNVYFVKIKEISAYLCIRSPNWPELIDEESYTIDQRFMAFKTLCEDFLIPYRTTVSRSVYLCKKCNHVVYLNKTQFDSDPSNLENLVDLTKLFSCNEAEEENAARNLFFKGLGLLGKNNKGKRETLNLPSIILPGSRQGRQNMNAFQMKLRSLQELQRVRELQRKVHSAQQGAWRRTILKR